MGDKVHATILQAYQREDYDRAYPITIRADSQAWYGEENAMLAQGVIKIQVGAPLTALVNKNNFGIARVVPREGLAADECEKFELGAKNTLYTPLFSGLYQFLRGSFQGPRRCRGSK